MVSFIKTQLIKIRDKFGRVIERNAIKFIFEFGDGFSNNNYVIGNNQLRNFGI
jgi:hypothetical protein